MIRPGQIAKCTVTEIGPWGAYAVTKEGNRVFINFGELSWLRIKDTSEVVSTGDVVDVAIMREPKEGNHVFLGSIKRAEPERNPWNDPIMKVGTALDAAVVRVGKDVVFFELPNGVVVGVASTETGSVSVGQSKKIVLTHVAPDSCIVEAVIGNPE